MLHEILLALAGGPSPLLYPSSDVVGDTHKSMQSFLSPAEQALLQSLAKNLGQRHMNIRHSASSISAAHPSTVCRAVSTVVISTHLARFRRRILEVEKDILAEDPSIVGAYNIVPLSAIVGAFDGWGRKLEWLWDLVRYMQTPQDGCDSCPDQSSRDPCTAAAVIRYLRNATQTGYQDIEEISMDLVKVAETAWLKQVSAWVLYGRHPATGAEDFFITRQLCGVSHSDRVDTYAIEENLIPPFVTKAVAQSILFIGKSLNQIRERQSSITTGSSREPTPGFTLLQNHLAHLSALQFPISPSSFSAAIGAIRLSLSQNALQKLLPLSKMLEILYILKDFFLLERGEFAIALLTAADERLSSRRKTANTRHNLVNDLASMTIKEGEVAAVLARTWSSLASLQSLDDEEVDEELDQARELLSLSIKTLEMDPETSRNPSCKPATASFDDVLLPSSTILTLRLSSPLDLFLDRSDIDTYSYIHAYLLAIRRAHLHLSKLFLLSVLRREHPSPKAPALRNHSDGFDGLAQTRAEANERSKVMRPIWATIGSAAFFLAEVGEYFQGEVVKGSWSTASFHSWLTPSLGPEAADASLRSSMGSAGRSHGSRPTSSRSGPESNMDSPHDPETLTQAHRRYLDRLKAELLLHNAEFTDLLRRFMTSIDHLSALMRRLSVVQQNLDSQANNIVDEKSHHATEAHGIMDQLQNSRIRVCNETQALVEVLRTIDAARNRGRQYEGINASTENGGFVPWTGAGLDRLLLKFDYGDIDRVAWAAS